MGHARFSQTDFLVAAQAIVAARGPAAVTIASVAARLKAPTGSFYHRFSGIQHPGQHHGIVLPATAQGLHHCVQRIHRIIHSEFRQKGPRFAKVKFLREAAGATHGAKA